MIVLDQTDWVVKFCGSDEWEGCEPGWYWGDVSDADAGHIMLADSTGPYETAADAAWVMYKYLRED